MEYETHVDSMREIDKMLRDLALTPGVGNEPVLAIHQMEQMRAKNGGYPVHMYHARLDPITAINRQQEEALASRGYSRFYITRHWPKYLYRRNMEAKYEPRRDPATGVLLAEPFIEHRIVKTEDEEKSVKAAKIPKGCGEWKEAITGIDPIPDGPSEAPELTISRLEGQLAEARRANETAAAIQKIKAKE